jgi:hypothetical protein
MAGRGRRSASALRACFGHPVTLRSIGDVVRAGIADARKLLPEEIDVDMGGDEQLKSTMRPRKWRSKANCAARSAVTGAVDDHECGKPRIHGQARDILPLVPRQPCPRDRPSRGLESVEEIYRLVPNGGSVVPRKRSHNSIATST